jgi:hypothetical protein
MDAGDRISQYIERLQNLYDDIRLWSRGQGLDITREEERLLEQDLGTYSAPALKITCSGKFVASVKPIGANVIGASGRVDIIGRLDKDSLVYLQTGPHLTINTSTDGEIIERSSKPFFKGVTDDGWYRIEEKRLGRARLLDQELFLDLLTEVSDYVADQSAK